MQQIIWILESKKDKNSRYFPGRVSKENICGNVHGPGAAGSGRRFKVQRSRAFQEHGLFPTWVEIPNHVYA